MSDRPPVSSRLNSMAARRDLWPHGTDTLGKIRRAGTVRRLDAIDLNYPQHFLGHDIAAIEDAVASVGLGVSAINIRFEDEFLAGAFTNPHPELRHKAIALTIEACAVARRFGATQVVVWPGQDGYEYPFQVDYAQLWQLTIEAFRAICDSAPDIEIAIEYKPIDPRRFYVLGDMGTTLLAISDIARQNVGVTMDFIHSLMAAENPAQSAQMAAMRGKLFGLHLNDGYGHADDGLMVGAIHPVQTMETLAVMRRYGYRGHVYFDTFPVREDPVAEAERNIGRLDALWAKATSLDQQALAAVQDAQDALAAHALLDEVTLGSPRP